MSLKYVPASEPQDLFPGVMVPAIDYGRVKEYIEKKLVEQQLQVQLLLPFFVTLAPRGLVTKKCEL